MGQHGRCRRQWRVRCLVSVARDKLLRHRHLLSSTSSTLPCMVSVRRRLMEEFHLIGRSSSVRWVIPLASFFLIVEVRHLLSRYKLCFSRAVGNFNCADCAWVMVASLPTDLLSYSHIQHRPANEHHELQRPTELSPPAQRSPVVHRLPCHLQCPMLHFLLLESAARQPCFPGLSTEVPKLSHSSPRTCPRSVRYSSHEHILSAPRRASFVDSSS